MIDVYFDRTVAIQFGQDGQFGKKFTDLRVTFDITKTSNSETNKAKIQVYNMTADSRALAEKKKLQLKLEAGYAGKNEIIFSGDIQRVLSRREGADMITEFEPGDGELAYNDSVVNKSFAPGISFSNVLQYVSSSFGLPIKVQQGVQKESYLNGISVSGSAKDVMNDLTEKQGLIWSIQDGAIQILKKDTGIEGVEAVRVSSDTGLIGSPKKKGENAKAALEVTSLLNPKIRPDAPVFIDSIFIKGVVVPRKVMHKGDSQGGDYFTIFEADFNV